MLPAISSVVFRIENAGTVEKPTFPAFIFSGDGGIRTLVPRRANAFRVFYTK